MYFVPLQDLEELDNELLLSHSPFIRRNGINKMEKDWKDTTLTAQADQVGVLMDLWSF